MLGLNVKKQSPFSPWTSEPECWEIRSISQVSVITGVLCVVEYSDYALLPISAHKDILCATHLGEGGQILGKRT